MNKGWVRIEPDRFIHFGQWTFDADFIEVNYQEGLIRFVDRNSVIRHVRIGPSQSSQTEDEKPK